MATFGKLLRDSNYPIRVGTVERKDIFPDATGLRYKLYFGYMDGCPACMRAKPAIDNLEKQVRENGIPLEIVRVNIIKDLKNRWPVQPEPDAAPTFLILDKTGAKNSETFELKPFRVSNEVLLQVWARVREFISRAY